MPSMDELSTVNATDGDLSTVTNNDDGTIVTDWPDGKQRVDYPDSSVMVTFADGSVMNQYADGTVTLNDANGNALDPSTGAPLGGSTDTGTADQGSTDQGATDQGTTDQGTTDQGTTDQGSTDMGEIDGTTPPTDQGTTDQGSTDQGSTDQDVTDLGEIDGGTTTPPTNDPFAGTTTDPSLMDTPPEMGPDHYIRLIQGDKRIESLDDAKNLVDTLKDAIKGEINPVEWVKMWFVMVLSVVKALETEQRGVYYRAWCYTVLYSALNMGTPPEPTFQNSLGGPEQDQLDLASWRDGVNTAMGQLADGTKGVSLRNRALLRIAINGRDPQRTLKEMYIAACDNTDDKMLRMAYEGILGWPQPTGA